MQVKAELKNLRISPRKVRLVAGLVRGMDATHAKHQLNALVKRSAHPVAKLLDSAIANATNNFNLEPSNLFVKDVNVDEGPKLKRFRPKGFGRTSPIEKKTSHVRIILEEKIAGIKAKKVSKKEEPAVDLAETMEESEAKQQKFETKKPEIKKEIGRKGVMSDIGSRTKKLFRRKAV